MMSCDLSPPRGGERMGHVRGCPCCVDETRRGFLRSTGRLAGAAALLAVAPGFALAASGKYEAMVVSCIDPRFVRLAEPYMAGRNLSKKYSQFVVAGGPIGVVAPAFADWRKTFFDNLQATIDLHSINRVIGLTHLDCGAAKIAYGADAVAPAARELETHRAALVAFREAVLARHPKLSVEIGAMALGGGVTMLG